MFDMPISTPIETISSEQEVYFEDSRYSEMISNLATQFENPLLNSLTSSQIQAVLDTHFHSIYERSLDWFDRIEALADRLANEENPDPELCYELRDFVVSLVRIGSIEKNSWERELLDLEISNLFTEEEYVDEEYLSAEQFMYAPNNSYKIEWRFPNWKDNFTVEYVLCKNPIKAVGHGVAKAGKAVGKGVAKGAKKTAKFVKKHKTAVIVAAVVVTATVVTVGIAAAPAAAAAGTAAGAAAGDKDKHKSSTTHAVTQPTQDSPSQTSVVSPPPALIPQTNLRAELLNQKPLPPPGELIKDRRPDFDIGEKIKEAAAVVAHEIWHPIGKGVDQARKEGRDIEKILNVVSDKISPFSAHRNPEIEKDVREVLQKSESALVAGHKEVDDFLGIKREKGYEEIIEARQKGVAILEMPLPGTFQATRAAELGGILNGTRKLNQVTSVAEELSLAQRVSPIEKAASLENRVSSVSEKVMEGGTSTVRSIASLEERILATQASTVKGWKVGEPVNNLTSTGKCPKWSTVKERHWLNRAEWAKSNPHEYTPENLKRMEEGLAPQRKNPLTGEIESKELHHSPPQRDGGLFDFIEVWPDEHADLDKYRRIKGK